jgi:hypothetical protein
MNYERGTMNGRNAEKLKKRKAERQKREKLKG